MKPGTQPSLRYIYFRDQSIYQSNEFLSHDSVNTNVNHSFKYTKCYHYHYWELTINRLGWALFSLIWVLFRWTGALFSLIRVLLRLISVLFRLTKVLLNIKANQTAIKANWSAIWPIVLVDSLTHNSETHLTHKSGDLHTLIHVYLAFQSFWLTYTLVVGLQWLPTLSVLSQQRIN